MSDLDVRPQEYVSTFDQHRGPETLVLSARKVYLGTTTEVARALPERQIRMIGAWCFLDHYGPEDVSATPGMQLVYLGTHRESITVRCARSARVMILGGEPYAGEIVMWWNFIGRSHDEIVGYHRAWQARTDRFPAVVDRAEKVMEAPPMPSVALRPRPRRAVPR